MNLAVLASPTSPELLCSHSDARRRASSLLRLDLSGLLDVDNQAIAVPMFLDALFKLIPTLQGDMLQV